MFSQPQRNRNVFIGFSLVLLASVVGCAESGKSEAVAVPPAAKAPDVAPAAVTKASSAVVAGASAGPKHALLVGCTYRKQPEHLQLAGPANDVKLMRALLKNYGFPDANIVVMTEEEAEDHHPTRAHIEREMKALPARLQPGAQVVIFLAGHGSQQPNKIDPDNPDDDDRDGMDEIYLPADIGEWSRAGQTVERAILDDEIGRWTDAMAARGANVWLIADCCQSGTLLRGDLDEKRREVSPEDLGIPRETLDKAMADAAALPSDRTRGVAAESSSFDGSKNGNVVAIYAAQSREPTVESTLPADGQVDHGLLTYTLCEVLSQTKVPLSYDELAEQIWNRYQNLGRQWPRPFAQGKNRTQRVLGEDPLPQRFILSTGSRPYELAAGSAHGLTVGSVLAVYPKDVAAGEQPLGYIKIDQIEPFTSQVSPTAHGDLPAAQEFPDQVRCQAVFIDFGALAVKLAADKAAPGLPAERAKELAALQADIDMRLRSGGPRNAAAVEQTVRAQFVEPARAEWLLQSRDGEIRLLPKSAAAIVDERDFPLGTPRFVIAGPEAAEKAVALMNRIFRAQNLRKLEQASASAGASSLKLEMLRTAAAGGPESAIADGDTLVNGDRVRWQVTNNGDQSMDVTLLYIDANYEVAPFYPKRNSYENTVPPDKTVELGKARVNDATIGTECVVLLAVPTTGISQDFRFLAAKTIEEAHFRDEQNRGQGGAPGAMGSPLGRLCQSLGFGVSKERGITMEKDNSFAVQAHSWVVKPTPKASKTP